MNERGVRDGHVPLAMDSKSRAANADEAEMQTPVRGQNRAAPQHKRGTIGVIPRSALWIERPAWPAPFVKAQPMSPPSLREYFIQGVTPSGQPFRPSDWAERLAGAMSCFRPEGVQGGIGAFIGYSPLCVPRLINGIKCVIVHEALREVEPMAWDFVMNFARDNQLLLTEACQIDDAPKR